MRVLSSVLSSLTITATHAFDIINHQSNCSEQLCKEYLNTLLKNINHIIIFQDQINSYALIFIDEYYAITILEYIGGCLYVLILYYILLCECIQILIITIIILEVEHEIRGKYKSYTVSEKKAILEETKVTSTQEVPSKQWRRRFPQIFFGKKSTLVRTL